MVNYAHLVIISHLIKAYCSEYRKIQNKIAEKIL